MKTTIHKLLGLTTLLTATVLWSLPSAFGANVTNFGATTGDFLTAANWSQTKVPGDPTITGENIAQTPGQTLTLTSNHTFTSPQSLVLRTTSGTYNPVTFDVSADLLNLSNYWVGRDNAHYAVVNQSAGTSGTTGLLRIGDNSGTAPHRSEYNISGGSILNVGTNIDMLHDSILSVQGSSADVNVTGNLNMGTATATHQNELEFIFGTTGVTALDVTGAFQIDSTDSLLTIDGSSYKGGQETVDLVTFGSVSGAFADPANIAITPGYNWASFEVLYDADSMFLSIEYVAPEPSTLGLMGMGAVLLFNRRVRRPGANAAYGPRVRRPGANAAYGPRVRRSSANAA